MKKSLLILLALFTVLILSGAGSLAFLADSESANVTVTAATWEVDPLPIQIDIKPGSVINSINPQGNALIPVAILSGPDFDATLVKPGSVTFGPSKATALTWTMEDVNGDFKRDLVLQFPAQGTGIQSGDTRADISGLTDQGMKITGSDSIRTLPPWSD